MAAKIISKICNFLSTAILVAVIVVAGGIMGLRVFGYEPMAVLSGSMEPAYHVGGLVFINTRAAAEDMGAGDVITYSLDNDSVVTHRVVSNDKQGRSFITKGDNNQIEDPGAISYERFVGAAAWYIPIMGVVLQNLTTPKGIAVECMAAAALILLFVLPYLLKPGPTPEAPTAAEPQATTEPPAITANEPTNTQLPTKGEKEQ